MRRAASLSVLLAAAALSMPSAYAADADALPGRVAPGDQLTVAVSCEPPDGPAPASIKAVSAAFPRGWVRLARVDDQDDQDDQGDHDDQAGRDDQSGRDRLIGPGYRGTVRIAPAEQLIGHVTDGSGDPDAQAAAVGFERPAVWGVDGHCPGGEQWTAPFRVDLGGPVGAVRTGVGSAGDTTEETNPTAVAGAALLLLVTAGGALYWRRRGTTRAR